MNDSQMTIVGNVVDNPKLRRTKSGHGVANFRVASTPRRFDRESGAWVDGATLFVKVTVLARVGRERGGFAAQGPAGDRLRPVLPARVRTRREAAHRLRAGGDRDRPRPSAAGWPPSRRDPHADGGRGRRDDDEGRPADESDHYLPVEDTAPVPVRDRHGTGEVLEYEHAG